MTSPMSSADILDREFLQMRARLLELAACFDRLQRSEGDVSTDPRYQKLLTGLEILRSQGDDQASQIQLLFSRAYEENWQEIFQMPGKSQV